MARQFWDEARHCEISIKLSDHMGTDIGEFAENTFLYEAACNPDPVLRLTGVNRALEGLAIDVFNTMREFGDVAGDQVLRSEEHTSELQSLMRISYAVFCLKKKKHTIMYRHETI